ncbi:AI-2E family transporter [Microlunatus parietis]|uniref:Putative PurR-regulated permease PerM n=1 Tax=Microlunatus parietis TaxID=682979 RepID=A0A7Y9IF11_9ACTN|nr:AI-2E family transporter [Microlunatus parietis]NYE75426.1 putative PurR-regulated permease PerM [Microlunatus parietis]
MTEPQRRFLFQMPPFWIGFSGTLGALIAFGLANLVLQARSVLILILVAMFIALGLNPMVELLRKRVRRRWLAVLIVVLGLLVVLGLASFAIVPVFTQQITNLVVQAPTILSDLLRNPQIDAFDQQYQVISNLTQFLGSGAWVNQLFGGILGAGQIVIGAVFSGFTLLILTLWFLASLPAIKAGIYRLAPASKRDRVAELGDMVSDRIGSYLSGLFVVVTCAGIGSFVFLWIVGIWVPELRNFALALAVLVALFDFIPMIGPPIAAVIVCVIAFVQSPVSGIAAVIYYLIYLQFESYVLSPRVMKRSVNVPGALVVIAALIGGTLLGVVGALIAVPTAAAVLLLLHEVAQPKLDTS